MTTVREPHAPDRPQVGRRKLLRDCHAFEVERPRLVSLDPLEADDAAATTWRARDSFRRHDFGRKSTQLSIDVFVFGDGHWKIGNEITR